MSTERIEVSADLSTLRELLAASQPPGDAGMSSQQLATAWKCGLKRTQQLLRAGIEANIIQVGRRLKTDISGRQSSVPVYLMKPNGRKRK